MPPREHGPRKEHRHGRHGHGAEGDAPRHHGAQTFRRGRALDFLEWLDVHRATLVDQLQRSELQAIHPVISGELKALELVRNEFIVSFELHEAGGVVIPADPDRREPATLEATSAALDAVPAVAAVADPER